MKWLYRIFRLFKCPHRWDIVDFGAIKENKVHPKTREVVRTLEVGDFYVLRCTRCKDLKRRNLRI